MVAGADHPRAGVVRLIDRVHAGLGARAVHLYDLLREESQKAKVARQKPALSSVEGAKSVDGFHLSAAPGRASDGHCRSFCALPFDFCLS